MRLSAVQVMGNYETCSASRGFRTAVSGSKPLVSMLPNIQSLRPYYRRCFQDVSGAHSATKDQGSGIAFSPASNHHGWMSDIFISYARADRQKAELLANAFSRKGWSVWWDREIPPGQAFDETIENALSSARCVLVLWSTDSVASRWVRTEAAEGAARGILVPVLIENVKIPLEFKRIEAADLSSWRNDFSDPEFEQLLRTVAGLIEGNAPAQPKQIPIDIEAPSARRWNMSSVLAGVAIGVIGSLGIFYQTGFFKRELPTQGEARSRPAPTRAGEEPVSSGVEPTPARQSGSRAMNLLSAEHGGQVVVATNDGWRQTIDGDEKSWQYIDIGVAGSWAVFAFKDGKPANFNMFKVLIAGAESWNLNEFELLAGNDSPTGNFEAIGKFRTQNVRFFNDPYQEFKFPPVKARYLKVRVISSHGFSSVGAYEFQLIGTLEPK
jgi:hypothetical protein